MIKTDYSKVSALFLTYPENFESEYHELAPFFEELISICPDDIIYFIIVNNENSGRYIKNRFKHKDIRPIVIKDFYEVWLRDIIGFSFEDKIVKPYFNPTYCKDIYTKEYLNLIDKQTQYIIKKSINVPILRTQLNWDCGNLGTNGTLGFITDKLITDNPDKDVKGIIRKDLGIEPIFIPTNKYDELGHTDGYLAFENKNEVILPKLPVLSSLQYDKVYIEEIERIIQSSGMKISHLYDRPIIGSNQNTFNAIGNYINYLNINNHVITPIYKLPKYKEEFNYNSKNYEIYNSKFKSVKSIQADKLAALGGVLHCVSFTF